MKQQVIIMTESDVSATCDLGSVCTNTCNCFPRLLGLAGSPPNISQETWRFLSSTFYARFRCRC